MATISAGFYFFVRLVFNIITGYFMIDLARMLSPFYTETIDEQKLKTAILVGSLAVGFWLIRIAILIGDYFSGRPYRKEERRMKAEMLAFKHEQQRLELEEMRSRSETANINKEIAEIRKTGKEKLNNDNSKKLQSE